MSRRGWALFLGMSVIWGVPYLLIKVAVGEMSPVVVVFGRCVLGAALLLPWTIARGRVRLLGMGLGVLGIALLLGLDVEGVALLPLLALALVLVGYATGPLVVTRTLSDVPGVAASATALTVTAVVYAPFAVPRLGEAADAPGEALLALVALGVVCTALALALFFALIREVGPQRALVITFLNPAVAVLLGVLLLGEPLTLGLAVGLPLIVVGCVLATRRSPTRADRSEPTDVDAAVP